MNIQIVEIFTLMRREIWQKRRLFAFVYLLTSMAFLLVGWNWPKVYTSSSTIMVDQQNILQPLMQGTAVTTEVEDRAKMAREIVFSRSAMQEVVFKSGLLEEDVSDLELERTISIIEGKARVENAGKNLLRISYTDVDAEKAFLLASNLTETFIDYSLSAKQKESKDAYEFINGQVVDYHQKLQGAEEALKDFQSANIDARAGTQTEVNARIVELRRRMEATQLEIRELKITKDTLQKQLSGEAAVTESLTREGQYRKRLAELEDQLSTLRLSYLDTYPDIVQIKTQIETIEKTLKAESEYSKNKKNSDSESDISRTATTSLLYQDLRSKYSEAETQLASLNARLDETKELLDKEEERIIRINDVEATLAELTRDYEVNQEIYQSLLRQRENARISMNIDKENQGLTFKVQEPAALQLTPKGIRFAHFLAAGFISSFVFPIGLIYGLTFVDQRIRSTSFVSDTLGLPVLASVYQSGTPYEYNLNNFKKSIILLAIVFSWVAYGYAAWLKVSGL